MFFDCRTHERPGDPLQRPERVSTSWASSPTLGSLRASTRAASWSGGAMLVATIAVHRCAASTSMRHPGAPPLAAGRYRRGAKGRGFEGGGAPSPAVGTQPARCEG